MWYVKPFWRKVWGSMNGVGLGSLGATTFYGEYGQYNDQFDAGAIARATRLAVRLISAATNTTRFWQLRSTRSAHRTTHNDVPGGRSRRAFVTGSEVERWGLGVVQEIDAAAMHVFARWQHQEIDLDITGISLKTV